MPQIHLRAEPGDYAPLVLLPGDPNRATRIAAMFDGGLDRVRKVNDHRALYGYTGTYQGVPVSVQTTGMGTPSFSIVVEELLRLGATRLIRVGTCGGIGRGIHTGDLVVATAAAPVDGSTRTYLHGDPFSPVADFGSTRALVDAAVAAGVTPFVGPIATVDVFYNPDADYVTKWRGRGILGFEMEAAALFTLAGREQGAGKDVRAACALIVSDTLSEEETSEGTYMSLDDLERATDTMIRIALEAGIASSR
jgi:purine-nucleoside phosphorylase